MDWAELDGVHQIVHDQLKKQRFLFSSKVSKLPLIWEISLTDGKSILFRKQWSTSEIDILSSQKPNFVKEAIEAIQSGRITVDRCEGGIKWRLWNSTPPTSFISANVNQDTDLETLRDHLQRLVFQLASSSTDSSELVSLRAENKRMLLTIEDLKGFFPANSLGSPILKSKRKIVVPAQQWKNGGLINPRIAKKRKQESLFVESDEDSD